VNQNSEKLTPGIANASVGVDASDAADGSVAGNGTTASFISASGLPKIIKFDSLARCGDEIWIENEGQIYRLRKTRQGKLILTK
jgi:hemin uptake protein HemP